ncbi:protein THYLAKOID ASSEMBLY 8, chloroplastic-like [Diospyros lotus]|uniref:protein THYLAKOID ASSEMBLY 8, chloroplastic-like n=1 Tax=Diospyros lotus TaxID=55363 RepID=UPI002250AD64|nr:protein THYLAKOID ASSEMBLY 8, chloroplastic-like [Diospyros lotus]
MLAFSACRDERREGREERAMTMNWRPIATSTTPSSPFSGSGGLQELEFLLQQRHNGRRKQQQPLLLQPPFTITMRDRSKNRKPLQRGRSLSTEAIHAIQALKRAHHHHHAPLLHRAFASNFKRLLKSDMMAVLRELLRQNQCLLALQVFEHVRKEYWYKPQVSLYAEIISVLGSNGLYESIVVVFEELKMENGLDPDREALNALLESLMSFNNPRLAMECFYLMKLLGCEPDKSSFRILINGLESKGETGLSAVVRHEAEKYYGQTLELLQEEEEKEEFAVC